MIHEEIETLLVFVLVAIAEATLVLFRGGVVGAGVRVTPHFLHHGPIQVAASLPLLPLFDTDADETVLINLTNLIREHRLVGKRSVFQ